MEGEREERRSNWRGRGERQVMMMLNGRNHCGRQKSGKVRDGSRHTQMTDLPCNNWFCLTLVLPAALLLSRLLLLFCLSLNLVDRVRFLNHSTFTHSKLCGSHANADLAPHN